MGAPSLRAPAGLRALAPYRAAAFLRRDWANARSYRLAFVLELLRSLFLLVLMFQVGRLVDRGPPDPALGDGYFSYALVGVAVLQVVQTALQSFAQKLRDEQTTGTLEALLATPMSPSRVILASALYDVLAALALAAVVVVLGFVMGVRLAVTPLSLVVAAVVVVGLLVLAAALGVAVAAFTVVFKRGMAVAWAVTSALSLLGGIFYPVDLLPGPLRWAARALPFTWGLDALRAALLEAEARIGTAFAVTASAVALLAVALWLFRLAVDRARTLGSLAQY